MKSTNIHVHEHSITRENREYLNLHAGKTIFFTGLSASGKSTLANEVEKKLHEELIHTYILDGDNIRTGLNSNLTFTDDDRKENIRRIGEVSKLFVDAGTVVLASFIAPFKEDRNKIRERLGKDFIEIHVDAKLSTCEERDPKGLYKKARAGEIPNFTGIDSPYEVPENPELTVNTSENSIKECTETIVKYILNKI